MTATQASRAFSALLDAVDAGETVTIERAGRRVAVVSPATTANGVALKKLLARRLDGRFGADLAAVRDLVDQQPPWPDA